MTNKKTKKQTKTAAPVDKARSYWLAGLGAVSIAQKRGSELVTGLTGEGRDLQARAQALGQKFSSGASGRIEAATTRLRAAAKLNVEKVATAVQRGIAAVLTQLGIPSKADIEGLTQRVAALSRQLKNAK